MVEEFEKQVLLSDLAFMYGLDIELLAAAGQQAQQNRMADVAETELKTLKVVQKYLTDARAKIRFSGESFAVPLIRIPIRILSIEKDRLMALGKASAVRIITQIASKRGRFAARSPDVPGRS